MKVYNLTNKQTYNFINSTKSQQDKIVEELYGSTEYETYQLITHNELSKHATLLIKEKTPSLS